MNSEPLTAAANAVGSISNYWQVLALVVIGGFGLLALWITRVGGDSKKLVAKSDELEKERTEKRGLERDHKMVEQENRIMTEVNALNNNFKQHLDAHHDRDNRMQSVIDSLSTDLRGIQRSMVKDIDYTKTQLEMKNDIKNVETTISSMEKTVTVIHTILEEREKREQMMRSMWNERERKEHEKS